ncbi:hypothetical protein BJ138DRAFT_575958 [Hygrophoropsis aurantiaca]|uniref:Uncharacterized protein n=1 Tax=Hygrophoropsis aurantiaca TaxID=72124 RepID=A0ACB8A0Z9_9AGAM|nr:hypothetical protein BJ138DRAFT_575958 [Hygrophoropsis aurantiaca]
MADPSMDQMLQMMQTSNYVTTAAVALVVYDQVLTFSHEVDYIWNRQWSFTTALYLIARYSGDIQVITLAASHICIDWTSSANVNITIALNWGLIIFILTMQAILVIRVYALCNRSKKVLTFLSTFYALQTTAILVMVALFFNKRTLHEYVTYISPPIGSVMQNIIINPPSEFLPFNQATTALAVAFDTILLVFALWAFVRHAVEANKSEGGWSINVLIRTLMADHLVQFVCNFTWLLLNLAVTYSTFEPNVSYALLTGALSVFTALVVVAGPRMVISLRAIGKTRREGVIMGDD